MKVVAVALVYAALSEVESPAVIVEAAAVNEHVGLTTLGLTVIVVEQTAGVVPAAHVTVIV